MFDPAVSIFGLPSGVFILALGTTGSIIGLLWLRSITRPEPEQTSFRALVDPPFVPSANLITGLALVGLAFMFFAVVIVTNGHPIDGSGSTMSIQEWLLLIGAALEVLAGALLVRRLWVRSRA